MSDKSDDMVGECPKDFWSTSSGKGQTNLNLFSFRFAKIETVKLEAKKVPLQGVCTFSRRLSLL